MEGFVPKKGPVAIVESVSEPLQQRGRRTCSECLCEPRERWNRGVKKYEIVADIM